VGVALYLFNPTPVKRLELRTIDARFNVRGSSEPDRRLVLIAVDDRTLDRLRHPDDPRLPRGEYARMLRRLRQDGARVIALDVLFSDPWEPRGDRALISAIRATHERLVLPFTHFVVVTRAKGSQTIRADLLGDPDGIRGTGAKTGYAGLPRDVDDIHRRANYAVDFVNETPDGTETANTLPAPTFAFAAADLATRGALSRRQEDLPKASGREEGAQSALTTWIDYRGPPGTFRPVSALDVLEGRVPAARFRDKLVVIGVIAKGADDVHRTPVDRGSAGMPGAEMQANAIDTLLRNSPLRDAPTLVDVLAIVLLGSVAALAGLARSRRFAALAIVIAGIVFLAAAQLAFLAGWIIAVVVPLAALLTAAAGVTGVAVGRAIRRRRARSRSVTTVEA
jgi:CHASE2 domain-containing sensor protein